MKTLSRRDFLKLSGLGLAGLMATPLNFDFDDPFELQQGRVTVRTVWVYETPSIDSTRKSQTFQRDALSSASPTPLSAMTPARTTASGIRSGMKAMSIRGTSNLSAPRSTAVYRNPNRRWFARRGQCALHRRIEAPDPDSALAYRVYYETTHWIKAQPSGTTARSGIRSATTNGTSSITPEPNIFAS
jgi:hypothetical protein